MEEVSTDWIILNRSARVEIRSAAKWAKFLAIIGFVFSGFFILLGIVIGPILSGVSSMLGEGSPLGSFPTTIFLFIYGFIAVIYFIPCWLLYKFAVNTENALRENTSEKLTESLTSLRRFFKFVGIMMIVILSLYILTMVGVAIATSIGVFG